MPKRLAEIVVDSGLASRDEVVRVAQLADQDKVPLVVALVRHGGVDELSLVAAIRRQIRVAIADPAVVEHDPDAIRELSRDACWRLRVMPLRLSVFDAGPRTLHLAMADPTDTVAVAEVEHLTGCQVEACLMLLSAVEEMVESAYRAYVTEVIPRDRKRGAKGPGPGPGGTRGDAVKRVKGEARGARAAPRVGPSTVPFHRVADEASLEVRHQALLELLYRKNLVSASEYEEQVRALMKRRDGGG